MTQRVAESLPPGVARFSTAEATPGRWWDSNNIRFRQSQIQPVGGNMQLPNAVTATPPRDILTWHDNQKRRWAAIGTDDKLYAFEFDTQTLYDITPAGVGPLDPPGPLMGYGLADYGESTYGTARNPADIGPQDIAAHQGDRWSLDTFGEDLLFVPTQDGHLWHWSPATPGTAPDKIAEAPILNKGVIVTDQRSVVLLAAGGDPRNIAWSDTENYHVWTPDVTNMAGSKSLQTQSYAMTAVKVAAGVLLFTANDLHMMQYVGPPYAYGITQVGSGCGLMSLRSPVAIGSTVIWPGQQAFWSWAGSVQPVQCEVADWFFSFVNRGYVGRVFGSPNPQFAEMWWDWPDEGATECNRYLALNFANPKQPWIIGVRARTAADPTGTMDYPVLGGPAATGGALYLHEYGWTDNGQSRVGTVYLESGAITVGEGERRFDVTQMVTDATPGMVGYRFLVAEQPNDTQWDTGLHAVTHNGLMDIRFSGRTAQLRMEALADGDFSAGRPRLVLRQGGRR